MAAEVLAALLAVAVVHEAEAQMAARREEREAVDTQRTRDTYIVRSCVSRCPKDTTVNMPGK